MRMRKLVLVLSSVAVVAASLAVPAMASFDPHFKVVAKTVHHHGIGNGATAFYEKVVDPARPQNKVGYDHGVCKPDGPVAVRCKATYHLDGEIGGHGDITVAGKVYLGSAPLKVIGGTGAFEGVEGTMAIEASDLCNSCAVQIFDLH
jgi:hypothetical protein